MAWNGEQGCSPNPHAGCVRYSLNVAPTSCLSLRVRNTEQGCSVNPPALWKRALRGVAQASLPAGSGGIRAARGSLIPALPSLRLTPDGSALAGHSLLDARCPLRIWFIQALQQTVGADFEKLRNASEGGDGKRKTAPFNRSDGLHMDAGKFGQTFLSQPGLLAGLTNVSSDQTQDFPVAHAGE